MIRHDYLLLAFLDLTLIPSSPRIKNRSDWKLFLSFSYLGPARLPSSWWRGDLGPESITSRDRQPEGDRPMFTTTELRVLAGVLNGKTVSQKAEELLLSHPSVSKTLRTAQHPAGIPLP